MRTHSRWLDGVVPVWFALLVASATPARGQVPIPEAFDAGTASAAPRRLIIEDTRVTEAGPEVDAGTPQDNSSALPVAAPAPSAEADAGVAETHEPPAPQVPAPETLEQKKVRLAEFLPSDPEAPQALARAQATAASAPAMVVTGGLSLGSYQAGFISTLVRFWSVAGREDPEKPSAAPRIWTGASVGALNALLGGLASCDPAFAEKQWAPESSLLWRVWIQELDLDPLLGQGPEAAATRQAQLFDPTHLDAMMERLRVAISKTRFRPDCSFGFGATVTNLTGRRIPFGPSSVGSRATLERVTEHVALQVFTDRLGKASARLPYAAESTGAPLPFLQLHPGEQTYYPALGGDPTPGKQVELRALLRAPQAASATPLAFAPVPLPLTFFDEVGWQPIPGSSFVDGGLLNNDPLELARRLARRWVAPRAEGFAAADYPVLYLDQDMVDWRWKPGPTPLSQGPLAQTYLASSGTLVHAAQDSRVLDALEAEPDLARRIKIPRRSSVLPSEFRLALLGFADRHFREHDFYRGMVDAIRFLRSQYAATDAVQRLWPQVATLPPEEAERSIRELLSIASPGFRCVAEGICGQDAAPMDSPPPLFALRTAADALTGIAREGQLREDDLDALLTALGAARYRYHPGALCPEAQPCAAGGRRSDLLPLRQRVGGATHQLLSNQPPPLAWVSRPVAAAALDQWLTYTPPQHVFIAHLSRARGLGAGYERALPGLWGESERTQEHYDRWEFRLGGQLSALGVVDTDQLAVDELRMRFVGLQLYLDRVSDLDGFDGALSFLALGPHVRWRVGLGISGSYVGSTAEEAHGFAVQLPELRLGLDFFERVGLRLGVPVAVIRGGTDVPTGIGLANLHRDATLGVEVLITRW